MKTSKCFLNVDCCGVPTCLNFIVPDDGKLATCDGLTNNYIREDKDVILGCEMTSPVGLNLCCAEGFELIILEFSNVLFPSVFHTPQTLDDNDSTDAVHECRKTYVNKRKKDKRR